jgi:hypothetical protein
MIPNIIDNQKEKQYTYPINELRNIGLDKVETSHVFLIDADFIPSVGLDKAILKSIAIVTKQDEEAAAAAAANTNISMASLSQKKYQYHALVVPAFERKFNSGVCKEQNIEDCLKYTLQDPEFMPRSMESLINCTNMITSQKLYGLPGDTSSNSLFDGRHLVSEDALILASKCIVFHSDYFLPGHGDTKTEEWLAGIDQQPETVRLIPCINTRFYEPYLAIPWCPSKLLNHDTMDSKVMFPTMGSSKTQQEVEAWTPLSPYYDERFYGYGKNKMQHIVHLQQKGYAFSVIPPIGFLTHHPHPESKAKTYAHDNITETKQTHNQLMINLFYKYKNELKSYYKRQKSDFPTKSCF